MHSASKGSKGELDSPFYFSINPNMELLFGATF